MESTTLTVLAGLVGSLVGGSASIATAWMTARTVNKREILRIEMRKREALYGDFIAECARRVVDSFTHTLEAPETLLPLYALVNRIRLCATPPVLREAERLMARITDQYFASNLTIEQVRELARSEGADPLRAFGEACRKELRFMSARV